ncbi:MAG TPA: hypothetical protein VK745_27120 [Polyangiaceae bacterium]|jgi:hypothetical protein|nr:hypothetical protein [Polyangiaceae bacterium]
MVERVACLSNGKLVVIEEGREPTELESPYAEQIGARERAMVRKNAWKTQGRGAAFMGGGRSALWGGGADAELPPARIVGVTRGRVSGELCYAISTGVVSGVFAQKPGTRDEQRLFHHADVLLREVDFSFADEAFTCTVDGKGGTSAIGVLADDGKGVRTVTEGDVLDRGPRWQPGGVAEIVYASAGIGRTQSGAWAGLSPFALHRLRLNDGTVEVLVSDAKYDYVAPVPVAEGLIYAIRRAYQAGPPKASALGVLGDLLLAPFRLLYALFQYLNFFSARYTGKSLLTRGNAQQKAADAERMMIWGNLVEVAHDADDAAHGSSASREARGYELVRITPKSTEVIAQGVLAFDIAPNGDVVYSSGKALYRMAPAKGSKPRKLADVHRVEQIVIC